MGPGRRSRIHMEGSSQHGKFKLGVKIWGVLLRGNFGKLAICEFRGSWSLSSVVFLYGRRGYDRSQGGHL